MLHPWFKLMQAVATTKSHGLMSLQSLSLSSFHPMLFVHETIYRAALQLRVG